MSKTMYDVFKDEEADTAQTVSMIEGCTAVATQTATPMFVLEHPAANLTPAENVQFDLAQARKHGAMTLAYLARAGWRLACERQGLNHGQWEDWCQKNLGISKRTVERYINFYYSTVGEYLRAQGTAHRLVEDLTDKMIAEATAGLESKTATGAMIELGIVKRPAGWGGEREGAGRKAAELPKLTKVQEAETVWAGLMAQLDKTVVMDTIPLLGAKAARVCHDRVAELARALKEHLKEF